MPEDGSATRRETTPEQPKQEAAEPAEEKPHVPEEVISINELRELPMIRVRPALEPQKLSRFLVETLLAVILFSAVWLVTPYSPFAQGLTQDDEVARLRTLFAIIAAGTSFFALVYYGTSFAVTPGRIIRIFLPVRVVGERGSSVRLQSRAAEAARPGPGAKQRDLRLLTLSAQNILSSSAKAAEQLAIRMERHTNTHLILGTGMGLVGLLVWYLSFFVSKTATTAPTSGGWEGLVREFIPRITILVFIEVLAGFYLRQYRVAVEDLKYFLELRRRADAQRIAYAIFEQTKSDEQKVKFAMALLEDKSGMRLAQGETTTLLETMKAEKNVAMEALSLLGDQLQNLTKAAKKADESKKTDEKK